jgi:UPF0716 family protein affecting phage T7 exclusion
MFVLPFLMTYVQAASLKKHLNGVLAFSFIVIANCVSSYYFVTLIGPLPTLFFLLSFNLIFFVIITLKLKKNLKNLKLALAKSIYTPQLLAEISLYVVASLLLIVPGLLSFIILVFLLTLLQKPTSAFLITYLKLDLKNIYEYLKLSE